MPAKKTGRAKKGGRDIKAERPARMPVDALLAAIDREARVLSPWHVAGCLGLYDRLDALINGLYAHAVEARLKDVFNRIMRDKLQLTGDVSSLRTLTVEEKRDRLRGLLLNARSPRTEESDLLWGFLRDADTDTEDKRNSLGIRGDVYRTWAQTHRRRQHVEDLDNLVAQCICRLDIFLKHFILADAGERARARGMSRSQAAPLLTRMQQLLMR
jgi:hypothetical protein